MPFSSARPLFLISALIGASQLAAAAGPTRLTPAEIPWPAVPAGQQAGSSMQGGVESLIVYGDAGKPTLYSIMFRVQPNAAIPAHSHPDDRSCFVVSGVWLFGYGDKFDKAALKALPPGSHYTEPAHVNHFAGTQDQVTVVECTSVGPAGTTFVDRKNDPRQAANASPTSTAAATDDLPVPKHLSVAGDTDSAPILLAGRRYAAFWNTGDARWAKLALAPDFMDRTLPPGRPQGTTGPLVANAAFRAAVPDLKAEMEDVVIAGDRISIRFHFSGHFTGKMGKLTGAGQVVDFQAFDIYRVANGVIAENWHLEDNLTFKQQIGLIAQ